MTSRIAFVFPGQGSQSIGMLAELAAGHAIVGQTFEQASAVLEMDLWALAQQGPEADLNRTDLTQPAMLAAGVAVWRVWCEQGGAQPACMAGHSLGEYTALVCSGALEFSDAITLVSARGRYMQEAVPAGQGAMAAVLGLGDDVIRQVCEAATRAADQGELVEAVNFNAPGQVVIAGSKAAVERAVVLAADAGAKRAITLPVSVPSHCGLMLGASERLAERLQRVQLNMPGIPVLHNVDARPAPDVDAIRDRLVRQLHSPVLWVDSVQALANLGVTQLIECGPGKVLAGLTRRIDRSLDALAVYDPATLSKALG